MITYVYEAIEVRLTGRIAQRKTKRATSRESGDSVEILHEIEPADKLMENWQKWVKKEDLYEVSSTRELTHDE